jgi:hypothetical protein
MEALKKIFEKMGFKNVRHIFKAVTLYLKQEKLSPKHCKAK